MYALLGLAGLVLTPLLLTAYMGEMIVTRSQFALPVAGAFLGMYVTERLAELWDARDHGTVTAAVRLQSVYLRCDCGSDRL